MIRYQREIAEVKIAASGTVSVPVQEPSIPPGAILVAIMSKGVDHGPPSITDTKGNTWVFQGDENELIDDGTIGIVTCVVTTELLPADIITFDHQVGFGEKTSQIHEFRAAGTMTVVGYSDAHSTFPHGQPRDCGTFTTVAGDAAVAGFLQNTATAMTWTPGTGFTALITLRAGNSGEAFSEWRVLAGTASTPLATSQLDTAGAGVQIVLRAAAPTSLPISQGLPTIIGAVIESGQPLFCSTGWWAPGGDTYTYQWTRAGVNIAGATNDNYTPVQLDVGPLLACRVTATNDLGTAYIASASVTVAQGPLPAAPSTVMLAFSGGWEPRAIRYPRDGGWT